MNTRQIAIAAAFLAIVFIAHAAGRILQIGGAQLAPSIAVYTLTALLLAPSMRWGPLFGIGLAVGLLTMVATSSPFPPANIPGHGLAFLLAAFLSKLFGANNRELNNVKIIGIFTVVLVVSWTLFSTFTWLGLLGSEAGAAFTSREFVRFNIPLGTGFIAWWLFGFVGVAIPSWIIGIILTPLLYRAVRPALVRQGMIEATAS